MMISGCDLGSTSGSKNMYEKQIFAGGLLARTLLKKYIKFGLQDQSSLLRDHSDV